MVQQTTHDVLNGHAFDRVTHVCAYCGCTLKWFHDSKGQRCTGRQEGTKPEPDPEPER
jgi:hypothetical protein